MVRLAWRNVWRNRRRTVLTAAAVALSCAVLVFFMGLQFSAYGTAINASTRLLAGHAQVQRTSYLDKPQIQTTLPDIQKLRAALERIPGVSAAAARAAGFALVSSEDRSYGVQIVGVEPEREAAVTTLAGTLREGRFLRSGAEAVIGRTLAKNLRVSLGDELTLMGQGADGSIAASIVRVTGIFESGSKELDRSFVVTPLPFFQETFALGGAGHAVAIVSSDLDNLEPLRDSISEELGKSWQGADIRTRLWNEIIPGLRQAIELDMAAGWLFYFSLVAIVSFSVLNTFLMSVLERTREFGTLLALGMRHSAISFLVFMECVLLLLLGLVPGIGLGAAILLFYGQRGFYLPGSEEILKLWNIPGAIYTEISLPALLIGPAALFCSSLLAVLVPAIRIRKLEPVEAMRAV